MISESVFRPLDYFYVSFLIADYIGLEVIRCKNGRRSAPHVLRNIENIENGDGDKGKSKNITKEAGSYHQNLILEYNRSITVIPQSERGWLVKRSRYYSFLFGESPNWRWIKVKNLTSEHLGCPVRRLDSSEVGYLFTICEKRPSICCNARCWGFCPDSKISCDGCKVMTYCSIKCQYEDGLNHLEACHKSILKHTSYHGAPVLIINGKFYFDVRPQTWMVLTNKKEKEKEKEVIEISNKNPNTSRCRTPLKLKNPPRLESHIQLTLDLNINWT